MASPTSTFSSLRALQLVIADALDDIQRVFSQHSLLDALPSGCSSPVYPSTPDQSPTTSPFPATPPGSFPPTPLSATFHTEAGTPLVDYPSPDSPVVPNSSGEQLALHPDAAAAASRIVAACGQMSNIVHKPFSSLCDAIMSYNLPACMRLVEHLHVAEILREAEENRQRILANGHQTAIPLSATRADPNLGESEPTSIASAHDVVDVDSRTPVFGTESALNCRTHKGTEGLHVSDVTNVICSYVGNHYVDPNDLVHALRLLSTHHIFRETAPDTFALTRVASLLDSGKSVRVVFSNSETKYDDTGGVPAFVALVTDELFKSAAYLTEAFTGVQLPTLPSAPNPSGGADAILPRRTTNPSMSSFVINDPVPCVPMTRSSSVLTHIMYPEDEGIQSASRPLPLTEPPGHSIMRSPTMTTPSSAQLPEARPSVPPSSLGIVRSSTPIEKERLRPADMAKPEKLPAFNLAFCTPSPFFEWLENGGKDPLGGTGQGASIHHLARTGNVGRSGLCPVGPYNVPNAVPTKSFRFDRFSKAMVGTTLWEAPKAILGGFDWYSLPKGSTVVDVGGGIGSTTMILARALNESRIDPAKKQDGAHNEGLQATAGAVPRQVSRIQSDPPPAINAANTAASNNENLLFVVQDRPVVTALGVEAWRSKCPDLLENGQVIFQDHDFFEPQSPLGPPHPSKHPAVYLLRVVLHDWPDECARHILINLRVASSLETRLVIAEHVLPLACVDGDVLNCVHTEGCDGSSSKEWTLGSVLANVEGAERTLVPPPLLSNLGKASANAYWMDLLMHITFNGKERTLREFCALALSAGWRVIRMTRPEGTLFAYLVCEPIALPDDAQAIHNAVVLSSELSKVVAVPLDDPLHHPCVELSRHKQLPPRPVSLLPSLAIQRSSSRCGTPTFGSRTLLPKDEDLQSPRTRGGAGAAKKWLRSKGLGVRGVMIHKTEKHKEEQTFAKCAAVRDNADAKSGVRAPSTHMRVWWKKSPPNSASNSSIATHDLTSEHRTIGQARRGTLSSSDSPSTPSPHVSPAHQKWPSTESASLRMPGASPPVTRARRPSVASITRKLSFVTFGRRPSIADITEPLPTPPHSATLTELAPPPALRGDTGRSLKHLPSLPVLGCRELTTTAEVGPPPVPRRPSFSLVGQAAHPVLKSDLTRRPNVADMPKSSILKSRTNPHACKQSSPVLGHPAELTSILRRERRVTLSNSPGGAPARMSPQGPGGVSVPPDSAGSAMKRIPSMPKLPRRLSIPMLRRKQSQSVTQDGEG